MSKTEFSVRPTPTAEEVAAMFPQYNVSMLVGLGAMGAVYHAIKDEKAYAIKLQLGLNNPIQEKQFRCEAEIMSMMDHENIVKVHDSGEIANFQYLIMDYTSRGTLHEVMQEFRFDEENIAGMSVMVCHGLAYAHKMGYIHRDIKPDNIMIDDDFSPKIMDFGLAVDMNDPDYTYTAVGSEGYAAPEILTTPEDIDQRVDVYAMGGVIYTMLTGVIPDKNDVDYEKLTGFDPRFKLLIRNAMNPDKEKRTASISEIERRLMNMMKSWELRKQNN